ncbi:histidinol dehydrogenase [Eubacteriales bacterium OttesenSCG-928-K08]|nr:histidinol dehydrogenase [Eubacteriales bacterium OttesenSCG-928-K08]
MIKLLMAGDIDPQAIRDRQPASKIGPAVEEILGDVKKNGDEALFRYALRFDKAALTNLEVTQEEIEAAVKKTDPEFMSVLKAAAKNIEAYHQHQKSNGFIVADKPGIVMGQRVIPLDRVGIYIPGGTASYPSTVLMNAIPARLAGVKEIIMVTPTDKDGSISPERLAAAYVCGVNRIFKVGGAQAIAALAYGTQTIPKVDKIVGPGNAYVAEAKRLVYGLVDIDMIAGPSEVLIIADDSANPAFVAADMLAQAEHDVEAASILLTASKKIADAVNKELKLQLTKLPRKEIAGQSLEKNGRIILVESLEKAVELSNIIAPEHLELCVEEPFALLGIVRHAGSVFLGNYSPEALGDYFAGPNHTLPTHGAARFSSPLGVEAFVKKSSYLYYSKEALEKVQAQVALFAKKEGLTAHANSATIRFENPTREEDV